MIIVDKILFLRRVSLFRKMTTEQLARLAGVASEATYPASTQIIKEGEQGDFLFLIVDGEVRIHRGEISMTTFTTGDCFGEMSIIDGEPRSASATAITDCLVLRLGHQDFKDVIFMNADVAWAIIQTLNRRLRETTSKL